MRQHFTSPVASIQPEDCDALIRLAIAEDAPAGDPTSEDIFTPQMRTTARLVARESGVLCGMPLVLRLLDLFEKETGYKVELVSSDKDGDHFERGSVLLTLKGPVVGILRLERLLLNFLQYLSGIATTTSDAVRSAPPGVFILDTRKTLPGYRRLAKYAVYTGGGTNHRIHLSEMAMIKDNHVAAAGGIRNAVDSIRAKHPQLPIEIEVDRVEQIPEALSLSPRVILLDNMTADTVRAAVAKIASICKTSGAMPPIVEVSGGWTPSRISELNSIELPVGVSMGFLTHTTRFLDLSLEVDPA